MLAFYTFCLTSSIIGSYVAKVNFPILPKQEIRVSVMKSSGILTLKGFVDLEDDFSYTYKSGKWYISISDKTQVMMRRFRCELVDILFRNEDAIVYLKMPIVGQIKILLQNVDTEK